MEYMAAISHFEAPRKQFWDPIQVRAEGEWAYRMGAPEKKTICWTLPLRSMTKQRAKRFVYKTTAAGPLESNWHLESVSAEHKVC